MADTRSGLMALMRQYMGDNVPVADKDILWDVEHPGATRGARYKDGHIEVIDTKESLPVTYAHELTHRLQHEGPMPYYNKLNVFNQFGSDVPGSKNVNATMLKFMQNMKGDWPSNARNNPTELGAEIAAMNYMRDYIRQNPSALDTADKTVQTDINSAVTADPTAMYPFILAMRGTHPWALPDTPQSDQANSLVQRFKEGVGLAPKAAPQVKLIQYGATK